MCPIILNTLPIIIIIIIIITNYMLGVKGWHQMNYNCKYAVLVNLMTIYKEYSIQQYT